MIGSCTPSQLAGDAELCVGCGLCCDGTLYSRARAEAEEEARLQELGHELTSIDGARYFPLPCLHHDSGRCTVYETRFVKCRSFRCALLQRYDAGELSLSEARTKIETVKRLLARIGAVDPDALEQSRRSHCRSRLEAQMASSDRETRVSVGVRLVQLIALDTYLARWFVNRTSRTHS